MSVRIKREGTVTIIGAQPKPAAPKPVTKPQSPMVEPAEGVASRTPTLRTMRVPPAVETARVEPPSAEPLVKVIAGIPGLVVPESLRPLDAEKLGRLIEERLALLEELGRLYAIAIRTVGQSDRVEHEIKERIEEAKRELGELARRVGELKTVEREITQNPPFFLRVVNHERVIFPVYGSVLVGRSDNIAMDVEYEFRPPKPDEIQRYIDNLQRGSDYRTLFSQPLVRTAALGCSQVLFFPNHVKNISRLQAVLELRASGLDADLVLHNLSSIDLAVNGNPVTAQSPLLSNGVQLADGDEIALAEGNRKFKVYKKPKYVRALVIACDNRNKHQDYFTEGADELQRAISAASRYTDVKQVLAQQATPERVIAELEALRNDDKGALVVVIIYMHGSPDRLHAWGGDIKKSKLTEALEAIPCRKILIANTCHAGGYWDRHDVKDALLLLSSQGDELTWGSRFLRDIAVYIQQNLMLSEPVDLKKLRLNYGDQHPPAPDGERTNMV